MQAVLCIAQPIQFPWDLQAESEAHESYALGVSAVCEGRIDPGGWLGGAANTQQQQQQQQQEQDAALKDKS
eukprot:1160819-Pelagomonas_calceolata.AAC.1